MSADKSSSAISLLPCRAVMSVLSCCGEPYCLRLSDACSQLPATVTMSLWLVMSQCCACLHGCTWSRDIMHRHPQEPGCSNHFNSRASCVTVQALAEKESDGMAKMIYRKDTGDILGVHIFGLHAADLIHEASNAMATHQRVQVCPPSLSPCPAPTAQVCCTQPVALLAICCIA